MPNQKESLIEDFAFDYLQSYYATRTGSNRILADKAERTKQGQLADGLFSLLNPDKSIFIASLHTGNSLKISSLLTTYKSKGLGKTRYITAGLLLLASLYIGVILAQLPYLYALPAAAAVAAAGYMLHSALAIRNLKRKLTALLNDLKKAPADEQWLGLSISSLAFRHNPLAKHLLAVCQRRGIGVITVGKRAKVVQLLEPKTQTCRRGDFLSQYEAEARIRKNLLGDSFLRVA
ncbi:hypothetical protein [Pontibacter russatus]|uniref:hypothetical protein n=1 Tax=Pontibacter russatus TaxID=2694929 RepID=UPI001379EF2B|nr:hypothetical protein [Pontibacter russatus]